MTGHMATRTPAARTFGDKLADELAQRKMSKRLLARKIAERTGRDLETERRALYKYLDDGVEPKEDTRAEITDALGMARGSLDSDARAVAKAAIARVAMRWM